MLHFLSRQLEAPASRDIADGLWCCLQRSLMDLKGATMRLLGTYVCILALGLTASIFAFGQQYPQNPPASTPPTFPEGTNQHPDQTQPQNPETTPNPQNYPDQYPPQNPDQKAPTAENPAPPPSSLTQTQTSIENAIRICC